MKLNKKAQWVRAQMREQKSRDRQRRVGITKELYKQGYSKEEIAVSLGVSSNTVASYIKEVKTIIEHEEIEQKRLNEIQGIEEKKQKYLNNLINQINQIQLENDALKINLNKKENTKKFSNNLIKLVKLQIEQLRFYKDNFNIDEKEFNKLKKGVQEVIVSVKAVFFDSIVLTLSQSFNSESNKEKIPIEEIKLFNLKFKKYISLINKSKFNEAYYLEFKELVKELDEIEKIKNLSKILDGIEKQFIFSNLEKIDELWKINKDLIGKTKPIQKELGDFESIVIGTLQILFSFIGAGYLYSNSFKEAIVSSVVLWGLFIIMIVFKIQILSLVWFGIFIYTIINSINIAKRKYNYISK